MSIVMFIALYFKSRMVNCKFTVAHYRGQEHNYHVLYCIYEAFCLIFWMKIKRKKGWMCVHNLKWTEHWWYAILFLLFA